MSKDERIQIRVTAKEKKEFKKMAKKKGFKSMSDFVFWLLHNSEKFLVLIVVLSLLGCATIFKQKERTVAFNSEPQGAIIYIDGNRMGNTPMPLRLSNKKPVTVTFRKEGYDDKTYIINNHIGAGWVILDCLGGFIPIVIDAVSENWYNLETSSVKVLLDVQRK